VRHRLSCRGSIASSTISTAIPAGISIAACIDAAVSSRSRRVALSLLRSAVSHQDHSQNDKARQNDWQSAKGARFGFHSGSFSRGPLHLKVIDNA